jgi:hypothetical protein
MQFIKMCSLAGVLMLCLSGSLWADSVTQGDVIAAFNTASNDIGQNWKTFESNKVLQSEFAAGEKADGAGVIQALLGHKAAAQADFQAAISDFNQVATGLTSSMPDAGSLALLTCSGFLLFGAMKRKFSS